MSYHGAPGWMTQPMQTQQYTKFVKLQQSDGTWAVAPVAGSAAPTVMYQYVPGPDGKLTLQQIIPQGPQFPKRASSITGKAEKFGANDKNAKDQPWTVNSFNKDNLEDEGDIIYTSGSKSDCYFWTRWLWCACMEPMHIVTTKYVESTTWRGCSKESDSKAMDIFDDAYLSQTCFQHIWNTCGCCCVDHGTITLFSAERKSWTLEKIHNANDTFDRIQKQLAKNREERRKKGGGSHKKSAGKGDKKK